MENLPEPKPFHMGGVMKSPSKIQAPQSKLFKEEDMNPDDFKTDLKEKELDLEALSGRNCQRTGPGCSGRDRKSPAA